MPTIAAGAAAAGKFAFTEEVDLAFKWLAKAWLKACTFAEQLIKTQTERDFQLQNLDEFQKCCEEMRAIVAFNQQGNDEVLPKSDADSEPSDPGTQAWPNFRVPSGSGTAHLVVFANCTTACRLLSKKQFAMHAFSSTRIQAILRFATIR